MTEAENILHVEKVMRRKIAKTIYADAEVIYQNLCYSDPPDLELMDDMAEMLDRLYIDLHGPITQH